MEAWRPTHLHDLYTGGIFNSPEIRLALTPQADRTNFRADSENRPVTYYFAELAVGHEKAGDVIEAWATSRRVKLLDRAVS
eukprot:2034274-Heterocapsa_arctica.AAC.1